MAIYHDYVGFVTTVEEGNAGVWVPQVNEVKMMGKVLQNQRTYSVTENANTEIRISNKISVVASPYAIENFQYIKYAVWHGVKWAVTSVDVKYPRLVLTLGGLYHEKRSQGAP